MKKIRILCLAFGLALLGMASSCRREGIPPDGRPTVVVSIEPLRYFTEQIAGERVRVTTMVPGGSSPETYEPTPQQLVDLDNSLAFFRVGTLGFEQTWMAKFVENAPELEVYDTSVGIEPLYTNHQHGGRVVKTPDPHTWTSPANARIIAANICRALCELDSAGAPAYLRRTDSLVARIDSVDGVIRRELADVRHRTFLIYHPALAHFARDYGLRQLSVESDGREPSTASVERLVRLCRAEQVKVVLVQKEYSPSSVEQIARDIGAPVVVINPLSYDWPTEMVDIARQIAYGE